MCDEPDGRQCRAATRWIAGHERHVRLDDDGLGDQLQHVYLYAMDQSIFDGIHVLTVLSDGGSGD